MNTNGIGHKKEKETKMLINKNVGIVVEGGGFRGIYTGGILDYFLEQEWHLPYVIGVSMGACNAGNYISKQKGRSIDIPYKYMDDSRYLSYRNLFLKGSLFGMDFIFNEIPYRLNHYDFETMRKSGQVFKVGTMDVDSGDTTFFDMNSLSNDDMLIALRASCSLPLISKMVDLKGRKYLDGGLTDSIPVRKAFEDGMEKVIVLLTREEGYIKEKSTTKVFDLVYAKYPKVANAVSQRHHKYNSEMEFIKSKIAEGKVLAIYPKVPIKMGRTERNKEKLMQCYKDGYTRAKELHHTIAEFIK